VLVQKPVAWGERRRGIKTEGNDNKYSSQGTMATITTEQDEEGAAGLY
jgi:hypothetical protein